MAFKNVFRSALKLNYSFYHLRHLQVHESKLAILNSHFGLSKRRFLHTCSPLLKRQEVTIIIQRGGNEISLKGKEGDSILDVIEKSDVDVPGYGACEGTLACSTCHVIMSEEDFNRTAEKASDEEMDMLDLAPDVCGTSRLGCQVFLSKSMDGLRVKVPEEVKDMRNFPGTQSAST